MRTARKILWREVARARGPLVCHRVHLSKENQITASVMDDLVSHIFTTSRSIEGPGETRCGRLCRRQMME